MFQMLIETQIWGLVHVHLKPAACSDQRWLDLEKRFVSREPLNPDLQVFYQTLPLDDQICLDNAAQ
jgi:hypothetical protein